jgi:hypothetical protein
MPAQADWLRALDWLRQRKRAYTLALTSPAGQEVLIDLAKFCRANETCFHEDARKHAVLEGRREVWLRVQQHLHLTTDQLMALYSGQGFNPDTEDTQ